ncbi:gliding-motility protein MglA [bacterium]|nr:gliding-motility protein MglA [bacterium]MCB9479831.1 gliding-motility protein MglA [Deltaproteobacteria bacterium]
MAFINEKTHDLNAKIVYVGPAGSGKSTNLRWIAEKTDKDRVGDLITMNRQEAGRTAYFDFLPIFVGKLRGFKTRVHLYSLPGNAPFNSTRRLILRGVDALVFVADSDPRRLQDNLDALKQARDGLTSVGLDPAKMTMIFQYNKRDLADAVPEADLSELLGIRSQSVFPAVASQGEGVYDTLRRASRLVLDNILEDSRGRTNGRAQAGA